MALEALLRLATQEDVAVLAEIDRAAFPVPNWPPDTFLRYDCTVAEVAGQVAGFLVSRQIFTGPPPEREILNLAVAPPYRRNGLATCLLRHECQRTAVFLLEVRESNMAARELYERFGFIEISRRRDYYDNPPESAIVMRTKAK